MRSVTIVFLKAKEKNLYLNILSNLIFISATFMGASAQKNKKHFSFESKFWTSFEKL